MTEVPILPDPQEEAKLTSLAVPLDSPVAQALRDFTEKALTSRCVALVAIAMTEQGHVLVTRVAPEGTVQSLGMIALGKHMLLGNATPTVQP
jgi:hypothetical protein